MGLLDVFKRGTPVERALKDLREPYAQPDVRRAAMQKLLEIGTEEAYDALMVRFTFNSHGHIADESEKRELMDDLVRLGRPAVPAIQRYIKSNKQVSLPIRALSRILERAELLTFLTETLTSFEPLDHRTTDQKRMIIDSLGDLASAAEAPLIAPYLNDHSDDVQMQAVEALDKLRNPETYDALAKICIGDAHAARIQRRAAMVLESAEHPVRGDFEQFNGELKSEFHLGKKGQLLKKTRPA